MIDAWIYGHSGRCRALARLQPKLYALVVCSYRSMIITTMRVDALYADDRNFGRDFVYVSWRVDLHARASESIICTGSAALVRCTRRGLTGVLLVCIATTTRACSRPFA